MKKTALILTTLALLLALVLGGCVQFKNNTTSSTMVPTGNVLTLTSTDPFTLDPATANESLSAGYITQIFSGLLKFDQNLEPVPDIAADMPEISTDGLTYTFHLRQDVKFQDGKPVTASDFKYSWERAADPATDSPTTATYLGDIVGVTQMLSGKADEISGVKVIDDYTLQVTIDSPKSYFLFKLTYPTSFVVDSSNVAQGSDWWQKPNGTGPFKLQQWVHGSDIILARNELYYREMSKIAQVRMMLNSVYSNMDLFETGQIDVAFVGPTYYDRIMDITEPFYEQLYIAPNLSLDYIGFNCQEPPFDDANIREAFCLAIDKDKIITLCYRDMMQKAQGILPPGMPGYDENLVGLNFNVNKAQELIRNSTYGDVSNLPPITMTTAGAEGSVGAITQALVYQWKQYLGVDVKIRQVEPEDYTSVLSQELDQMYYFGWIADYPYPQDFLDILFASGSSYNYGGYSNLEVDSLIAQANQQLDQDTSLSLYRQAEEQIINDAACLPLVFGETYLLVQPYVTNLSENALGIIIFNEVVISPH